MDSETEAENSARGDVMQEAASGTLHEASDQPVAVLYLAGSLARDAEKVFDRGGPDAKEERLLKENADLKRMIGELHVELKKSEEEWF